MVLEVEEINSIIPSELNLIAQTIKKKIKSINIIKQTQKNSSTCICEVLAT